MSETRGPEFRWMESGDGKCVLFLHGLMVHALIPESQLWLLSQCGHAPMLEQPQAFNAVVREWLDETWLRRAQVTLVEGAAR